MTTKQIVSEPGEGVPVYQWSDGSMAHLVHGKEFSKSGYTSSSFWAFDIRFRDGEVAQLCIDPATIQVPHGGTGTLEKLGVPLSITNDTPKLSAMLLGFIFDLMGPSYFGVRELIWDEFGIEAYGPRAPELLSDERWASRYETPMRWASRYETPMRHGRLLLDDLQIEIKKARTPPPPPAKPGEPLRFDWGDDSPLLPPQLWYAKWSEGNTVMTTPSFETREQAIDEALRRYPAIPESQQEEWFATNLEHGTWLVPSPEELEVIRILDERLPFFLPYAELREWLSARGLLR